MAEYPQSGFKNSDTGRRSAPLGRKRPMLTVVAHVEDPVAPSHPTERVTLVVAQDVLHGLEKPHGERLEVLSGKQHLALTRAYLRYELLEGRRLGKVQR